MPKIAELVRSRVSTAIREFREERGMNQGKLADATGMSRAQISLLENKTNDIVSPAVYNALLTVDLDLKKLIPDVIVAKQGGRGKDRLFHGDLSVKIRKRDPIRLLNEAKVLVNQASAIIKKQIEETEAEAEEHRQAINALEATKKEILAQKDLIFNEIVSCA